MVTVLSALRDVGYRTLCFAFHDRIEQSTGTNGCLKLAIVAGHESYLIRSDGTRIAQQPLSVPAMRSLFE